MKEQFVSNLKEGDKVLSFFLVKHKQLEYFRDRTKGQFLTLALSDKTGQVLARVWERAPGLAETFQEGDVVKVLSEVEEYLGRLQVIVDKLRPATEDEYELEDFLPHTERDIAEMLTIVRETIASVENPYLRTLLDKFFADEEFVAAFSRAPAARRIHHAYLGGLLEHTVEVIALCQTVLTLYPQIHRDLLITGALLHDVGKTKEFTYQRDIDYSDEGRLLGHVVLSDRMIAERLAEIPDFPPELALRLRHLVVSHHGRYEWGSPRRPKTLEACALHYVENLDAQVNRFAQIIAARRDKTRPWTEYDTLLGRYLYAGREEELAVEEAGPLE
ncbi:MAG: HD domain-containing protein [Chloroflexi bacterium]|nr:HD domain-containing protein [Chloroflexota bacterium]